MQFDWEKPVPLFDFCCSGIAAFGQDRLVEIVWSRRFGQDREVKA